MRGEPIGQIKDHTRKKSGLREPKQEAGRVKLPGSTHKGGAARDYTPRNKHAADPNPRTNLVKDEITRNLEKEIPEKKDTGAESVYAIAEFQVAHHLQFGKTDIHPVQVSDDVAKEHDRHNSPRDFAIERIAGIDGGDVWRGITSL